MTSAPPTIPLPLRLTRHDRNQLEVKSELLAPYSTRERAAWVTDLWFVLPQATGIAPGGYAADQFYEDLRAYVRLKTPVVLLPELVRVDGEGSPLGVLAMIADRAHGSRLTAPERALFRQECKLLSAILKSQLRDWTLTPAATPEGRADRSAELAGWLESLIRSWRKMMAALNLRDLDERSRDAMSFTDESLSVQVETAAVERLRWLPEEERASPGALRLVALAQSEEAHRKSRGWRTVLGDADGASYVDQLRLLKKYISSVLHLHLAPNRWDGIARQGVLAFAAGLAMLWAVGAQILMFLAWDMQLQRGVSLGFLGSFTVLAVLAYVLKDRIKASTATALSKRLPALLSDRRNDLTMPGDERVIGHISERMSWERTTNLPPEIEALRTASVRNKLLLRADQDVLRYTRQVELFPRLAAETFPRVDGLTDILRLNVWRWVRTYAGTHKEVPFVDGKGRPRTKKLDNLYFVEVIARVRRLEPEPEVRVMQLRLSLNRRGLEGVLLVSDGLPAESPVPGA